MFHTLGIAVCILLAAVSSVAAESDVTTVKVECDAGGDLAAALQALAAESEGPVIVEIAGTCTGPIDVAIAELTLRGEPAGGAAIEGPGQTPGAGSRAVLTAHHTRNLRLENLRISDGPQAIAVTGTTLGVESCDLARTDTAIVSRDSRVSLSRTIVRDSRMAVDSRRSYLDVSLSTIRDISDEGIAAAEFSHAQLFRSAIASDGLSVTNSTLVATSCELEGSILARAHSRVSLGGGNAPTSALRGSVSASNSEVFVFRLPVHGTLQIDQTGLLTVVDADVGPVKLGRGTHARITSSRVAGDVHADGFSTILLGSSVVSGDVVCERGSDAICEGSQIASAAGCPGCNPGGTRSRSDPPLEHGVNRGCGPSPPRSASRP